MGGGEEGPLGETFRDGWNQLTLGGKKLRTKLCSLLETSGHVSAVFVRDGVHLLPCMPCVCVHVRTRMRGSSLDAPWGPTRICVCELLCALRHICSHDWVCVSVLWSVCPPAAPGPTVRPPCSRALGSGEHSPRGALCVLGTSRDLSCRGSHC